MREALAKEYANVRFGQPYSWALYRLDVSREGGGERGAQGVRLGMEVGSVLAVWESTA